MKRRTIALTAAAAVGLVAALAWAFAPRAVEVEMATAGRGPFEVTIDEDGKTRLPERYVVSAPLAGRLARITLREGDVVAAGDVVAMLTPVLPAMLDERSAREAASRVEAAQAQLQRAEARVARVRVALEQARLEAGRSEQLARDGFIAPTKRETDALGAEAAARELDAAIEERHVAEHELAQARAALMALRQMPAAATASGPNAGPPRASGVASAGRGFEVRSPIAGQVLRVLQPSEGTVALATPLVEVGQLDRLEVVAELLTADALRTPAGTPVRIERWGGPVALQGRVRRVEPAAFTKVSALGVEEQRVNVVIDITSPRAQWQALGEAYRVSVRIVVTAEAAVLQVPASAVFPLPDGDGAAMAVFAVDTGRARLAPVKLRARNGTAAWIGGGLEVGARVIVYPPATVRDGVRVKERKG